MKLSESEIKAIEKEADSCYRRINSFAYPSHMNDIEREWIIKMIAEYLIAERIKAKKLIEALKLIRLELIGEFSEENAAVAYHTANYILTEYNKK